MFSSPFVPLVLVLFTSIAGVTGIAWSRCGTGPHQACWGRRLFLAALGLCGAVGLLAAWQPHRGLMYFGLAAGLLVIGMVWEGPREAVERRWQPEEL